MLNKKMTLEINKNERNYQFLLSDNSPLGEVFDVLTEMRSYVLNALNQAHANEIASQQSQPISENIPESEPTPPQEP